MTRKHIFQALKLAEEKELDLVEISPNAQPPVCRVIDSSKFLYQLKKRQKEQKAKQVKVNVKEIPVSYTHLSLRKKEDLFHVLLLYSTSERAISARENT